MPSLPMNLVAREVRIALMEDIGPGDLTCRSIGIRGSRASALLLAGEDLVVAGLEPARMAFQLLDPEARIFDRAASGASLAAGEIILEIEGRAASLLSAERTALNFLGRLSGIATLTRRCVDAVQGTGVAIYDTRKTTPARRILEREAVRLGGGRNHRFGLWDAVLIKDNHLAIVGGIAEAVRRAREYLGPRATIEVEVETLEGLEEAIAAGADIALLDNMPLPAVAEAVRRVSSRKEGLLLEASGGISLENIRAYAETGVERISLGMLTHSAPACDVSMEIRPPAKAEPG